jgi:hypothetical protein
MAMPLAAPAPQAEPIRVQALVPAAPVPAPIPSAAVFADVPVQRAGEEVAAVPAAAGGAHSDKELDDLARQLYDRLRSRLRMELLVDRERAGLITDLR